MTRIFPTIALLIFVIAAIWAATLPTGDLDVVRAVADSRSDIFTSALRFISAITTARPMAVYTVVLVLVLGFWKKQWRSSLFLFLSMLGVAFLSPSLKHAFARSRPPMQVAVYEAGGLSFPSGHALAIATFISCLVLLAHPLNPRLRRGILFTGTAIVLLVGISRVYLGVHYPSDVLGGWSLGFLWASLCWMLVFPKKKQPLGVDNTER